MRDVMPKTVGALKYIYEASLKLKVLHQKRGCCSNLKILTASREPFKMLFQTLSHNKKEKKQLRRVVVSVFVDRSPLQTFNPINSRVTRPVSSIAAARLHASPVLFR